MSAAVCAFILTVLTLCGSTAVLGVLRSPSNVRLTSFNMDLVLRWDPPAGAAGDLVYTTQYKSTVTEYKAGCLNVSTPMCDFTRLNISISEYGKYNGRVRAQLGAQSSAWVESNQLSLDSDTIIGPPNVTLLSNGATIEVTIKDPEFRVSTLRNVYNIPTYNITYWKDSQQEKARSISNIQQNRVTLTDLEVFTNYCVQVQISTRNPNPGRPSSIVCEKTTDKEKAPWVAAVVTFIIMVEVVAVVVVVVVYRKRISHFLCPKDSLPQHFKEDLLARPNSIYFAMQNSRPPKEIYHQVSIVKDDTMVEEGRPLEAAGPDCSTEPDVTVGEG